MSSFGTFAGGLVHVIAAALGLSAILATSAAAFLVVKYAGAIYLIWMGIKMIRTRNASNLQIVRDIRDTYVNRKNPPASTLVIVKQLVRPDLLVEVDAIAVVKD